MTTTIRFLPGMRRRTAFASLCLALYCMTALCADGAQPDALTADGGRYFGPLVDGKRQGQGRVEWDNGAHYEGGFKNGLYAGEGRFHASSGYSYEGHYKDGVMTGHGRYVMPDGSVYVGEFQNDEFNGEGRMVEATGSTYEGQFRNGMFEGQGRYVSKEEDYRGEFRKGRYWGKGEIRYKDGRTYRGEFVEGVFRGKGRYETADGHVYEGDFDDNQFTGKGSYTGPRGTRHVGEFRNWRPHGAGSYVDGKGNTFEGTFSDGALNGKGALTGKDGRRYEGEFRQWQFHGQGVLHYPNGDEYKGGFANGLFEGEGVFTYAKPRRDGRTRDVGTWHYGALENKDAERMTRQRIEAALYNQRAMLDAAVATLHPADPRKINMYFLAVAGDGSQEVFRREVEFVRRQFDVDFQTQGRSLVLANSHEASATYPMATVTGIRESLGAIARQMNRDRDILFLFLTSHGSRTQEFVLNQDGIELENLHANELGKMLAATGIRWKVIVVSACYSGGFIDSIKDDHTLVITAARKDRTSFGCADENDFTYFGRAFFEQSIPKANSFEDAFDSAKAIVRKWEDEDVAGAAEKGGKNGNDDGNKEEGSEHSEPQIYRPAAITQYLHEWRAQLGASHGQSLARSAATQAR